MSSSSSVFQQDFQNVIKNVQLPVGLPTRHHDCLASSRTSSGPSSFYQGLKTSVAPFICLQNFQIFSGVIKSLVDQLFSRTFETFNRIFHSTLELPNRQLQQDRLVGNRTSETSEESASLKQDFQNSSRVFNLSAERPYLQQKFNINSRIFNFKKIPTYRFLRVIKECCIQDVLAMFW